MPGLNILSVIPGTASDVSASQTAPKLPPQQSFAQVQAQMSNNMGPPASTPGGNDQGANASSDPNGPPQAAQGNSDSASSPGAPNKPTDGTDHPGQTGGDDPANSGAKAQDPSHQTDGGKGRDADRVAQGKAKADKAKTSKDDKTGDKKADRKDDKTGDKVADPAVATSQPLTLAQQQERVGSRSTKAGSADLIKATGKKDSGKKVAATAGKKQEAAGDKDQKTAAAKAPISSAKTVSGSLEQLLEKAVAQGARSGKGVAKRETAVSSTKDGSFAQQLRLQGSVGEGVGLHSLTGNATQLTANSASGGSSAQNATTAGAGPNAYATSVDLPVQHAKWGEQIAGKVTWLANQHIQVADIHVNPPDLGPVHVQLHLHNDQASVSMHSQHPGVRDMLEANGQRLRDMMQQGGFTLSHFDVSSQAGQQQQNQRQSSGTGSGFAGSVHQVSGLSASAEVEPVRGGSLTLGWSRLDLYA